MQTVYWILAILTMLVLLVTTIHNFIETHKINNDLREINKLHKQWLKKQLEGEEK